ncbi:MAG TPA: zinc ribbon domain-containing protein [Candidatus Dormibacteraeota bacterium]|jgi:hypothetical protein
MAALRAAIVAVPYGGASLVLFVAGHWRLTLNGQVLVSAAPAPIGVLMPLLVLGLAAAAGAVWARPARTRGEAALVRGAALGLLALLTGVLATVAIAVVAALVWLLASEAGRAASQAQAPVPSTPSGAGSTSASGAFNWSGLLLVALVLLLIVLYALNAVAGLWAANLGFWLLNLGPLAVVVLAGPVIGALSGAVFLRPLTDFVEQAAFIAAFAGGSFVLAVASQVTVLGSTVGGTPGVVLLVAGMLAAGAVAGAGAVARTPVGRMVVGWPPLAVRVARLDGRLERVVERPGPRPAANPRCPGCGRKAGADAVFCAGCGARIRPRPACAGCGCELRADDAFCAACGARQAGPPA